MGVGLTQAMFTAKTSLAARQQELTVVSNNIAKADQVGYHKQTVETANNAVLLSNEGFFGTGVHVSDITRAYDTELEGSLTSAMNTNGYYQTYHEMLSRIESLVSPNGETELTDSVSEFMNAVQDLANAPESSTYRTALLSSAQDLAAVFNQEYENLRTIRDNIAYSKDVTDPYAVGGEVTDCTSDFQTMLDNLKELNQQIYALESNAFLGQTANDLRDERDQLVKEISQYADVTVTEQSNSQYTLTVHDEGSGTDLVLVDGTITDPANEASYIRASLTGVTPPGTLQYEVYDPNTATSTSLTLSSRSGALAALQDARSYTETQMTQLYSFAQAITTTVNDQLALGEDLNGAAGIAMFNVIAAQPASGTIMSVTAITADEIAASDVDPTIVGADVERGNGGNMSNLWADFNSTITIGSASESISDYSNTFISSIIQDVASASDLADTSSSAVSMFKNAISNLSGVDTDVELTDMLEVQRAYAATAKVITAVESMFDALFAIG